MNTKPVFWEHWAFVFRGGVGAEGKRRPTALVKLVGEKLNVEHNVTDYYLGFIYNANQSKVHGKDVFTRTKRKVFPGEIIRVFQERPSEQEIRRIKAELPRVGVTP